MRHAVMGTALAVSALTSIGCTTQTRDPEKPSELILALQTNMDIPKDVDVVGISITSGGTTLFNQEYDITVDPKIPATLAIKAGTDPTAPVKIRVWSRAGKKIKTLRETVTTIPQHRIGLLNVPIEWLCEEKTKTNSSGKPESACEPGQTCVGGKCVSSKVEPTSFVDYSPKLVFSGDSPEEGMCFDMKKCFQDATRITVNPLDPNTWKPSVPNLNIARLNLALELPPGSPGVCDENHCLLMLDYDPQTGWQNVNEALKLAPGVVDKLIAGKVLSILATDACPTKTIGLPLCGPYSSVQTPMLPDGGRGIPPTPLCERPDTVPEGDGWVCVNIDWPNITYEEEDDLDGRGDLFVGLFQAPPGDSSDKELYVDMLQGPVDIKGNKATLATSHALFEGDVNDDRPFSDTQSLGMSVAPGDYYVWAVAYDNARESDTSEGSLSRIRQGGAFIGGVKLEDKDGQIVDLRQLKPLIAKVHVGAGQTKTTSIKMIPLRQLEVRMTITDGVLGHEGDPTMGWFNWRSYASRVVQPETPPIGWGLGPCTDAVSPFFVKGVIAGEGPHHLVGMFYGYKEFSQDPTKQLEELVKNEGPHTVGGGAYSGQETDGSVDWISDVQFQVDPRDYKVTANVTIGKFEQPEKPDPMTTCPNPQQ